MEKEVDGKAVEKEVEEREDGEAEEVVGEKDDKEKEVEETRGDEAKEVNDKEDLEEVKEKVEEVEENKGSEEVEEKELVVPHEKERKEGKQQWDERHWKKQQQWRERGRWREGEHNGQVEDGQRAKVRVRTKRHLTEWKGDPVSRTQPACDTPATQRLQACAGGNPARKTRHCHTPCLQWKLRRKCPTPSVVSNQETCGTTTMTQLLLVFLGLVAMACAGLEPVSLHVERWGRTLQGKNYSLVCVVTPPQAAHTSPAFSWYRNGTLLVNQTGQVLNFSPLSKQDEGDYRCGLNLSEVQLSHSFSLEMIVLENISLVPEVEVEEGQTVILNCSVHSDPTAFLTWRVGGKTLYTVRSNSDSLVLHNASQYHLQIVECEAYNNGLVLGFLDAYSLIRLKGTYEVVDTPWLGPRGLPVLHRPFGMECLVMELPTQGVNVHLTYTWYKDDKVIEGQSDMILDFPSISKKDQGVYTCTARNGEARTTSLESNTLDVLVLLPPVVHIERNTNITDNVIKRASGETLTLTCKVTEALPWVNKGGYRWSYLPSPGGQPRPLEGRESTLTLGPLTREDSGQYICQAWNDALFERLIPPGNASVTVDVTYLENVTLTSTREVSEGDHVTLTCIVDSNPAARLSWLVEGREVRHATANVDHYVLERAACSDNKTYTCRASNPHLPGLEITKSSDILVNCTDIARSTPHSSSANVTSVVEDEGPQADVSSSSFALTVGLSVSMSILVVAVIVAVIVIIVHHTGRNHERPSSVEQYRNCPSGDAV